MTRLQRILNKIAEKLYPHRDSCNLVAFYSDGYGLGCTCDQGKKQEELKKEITDLYEEEWE